MVYKTLSIAIATEGILTSPENLGNEYNYPISGSVEVINIST